MPKPGTRNVLYVLSNGAPEEWALVRDVPEGELPDGLYVARFDAVPDDLADQIEASEKPKHYMDELLQGPHQVL